MQCNAMTKANQPCVYAAKENGYCGIHKNWAAEPTVPEQDDTEPEEEKVEHNNSRRRKAAKQFINKRKKEVMYASPIFHYMEEIAIPGQVDSKDNPMTAGAYFRHIETTFERPEFNDFYRESLKTGMPHRNILALDTGDYWFSFLSYMAAHKGIDVQIKTIPVHTRDVGRNRFMGLDNMSRGAYEKLITESNFFWANADNAYFVKFPGIDGWGLGPLGITTKDVEKLAKRLAEIPRSIKFSLFMPDGWEDIKVSEFSWIGDEKAVDGCMAISRKLFFRIIHESCDLAEATRLIKAYRMGKLTRHTIRVMANGYMLKGHTIVLDELPGGVDVLYHGSSRKSDIGTDGPTHITLEPYGTFHHVAPDTQSKIGNRMVLREDKERADLLHMEREIYESLNLGELPKWLLDREEYHGEDAVTRFGQERLDALMAREYMKPQQYYMAGTTTPVSPKAWANLPYMAYNGVLERFNQAAVYSGPKEISHYRKYWTVSSNAFSAPVITHELLKVFGVTIGDGNTSITMFDERYGLVMPAKRFIETYDLHGGWDLDDSVPCYLVKIYGSAKSVKFLKEWDALDGWFAPASHYDKFSPEMKAKFSRVGRKPEEAAWAMVLIRRPNGPGEYSIEVVRDPSEFNWYRFDPDHVPVLNLDSEQMAKPAGYLKTLVTMGALPPAEHYTGKAFTRDQAKRMLETQKLNPQIGGMAAANMLWSNFFGVSYPEGMPAPLEDCVDETQAKRNRDRLIAIGESVDKIHENMVAKILGDPTIKLDAVLTNIYVVGRGLDEATHRAINKHKVEGRFTRFNKEYKATIARIRQNVVNSTFKMRNDDPLVQSVKTFFTIANQQGRISESSMRWCREVYDELQNKFQANQDAFHHRSQGANQFIQRHLEDQRNAANRAAVDGAVARFQALGEDVASRRIVLFWYWLLLPSGDRRQPNRSDRVICAPGNNGNLLDLLLKGLVSMGFIVPRPD